MIYTLAEKHRLKVRRAEDGELLIPGRHGHLYEHEPGLMGLCLSVDPPRKSFTPRKWGCCKRACLTSGMRLHQDGDDEGTLLFDPADVDQVQLALTTAGVKRKRALSREQRASLVERGRVHRFRSVPGQTGTISRQKATTASLKGSG